MSLELAKVPQILSMLNLTDEQKKSVEAHAKEHNMFFGKAAIQKEFITEETLQAALFEQARQKAVAAEKDIETIATKGTQDKPPFLKANFGNNGVNKAIENPTLVDAAQSAGNIAQNIVMIANDHPELAKELKPSVEAASRLSQALTDPKKAAELSAKDRDALITQATEGLRTALQESGEVVKDGKGQPISLDEFISNRSAEITKGHELGVAAYEAERKKKEEEEKNQPGFFTKNMAGILGAGAALILGSMMGANVMMLFVMAGIAFFATPAIINMLSPPNETSAPTTLAAMNTDGHAGISKDELAAGLNRNRDTVLDAQELSRLSPEEQQNLFKALLETEANKTAVKQEAQGKQVVDLTEIKAPIGLPTAPATGAAAPTVQ